MAKNDWIVAGLNNPDFTSYDFSTIADMDLNNTQMLSANEYLKSDFIKNHDMFKDDNGNFSEDKFRKYHTKRLQDFQEFQEQEFPKGPELDMFDTDRTQESRVKDVKFELGRHVNPDRQAVGIEGVRVWSDPTQTRSEIAQAQRIWDTAKGEYKDYSSNDKALSNGLFDWLGQVFSDPLVMAQWEEDGEHIDPITGITQKHKKGEYKLNDKGTYYYETLNDRSPIGKEVLSVFDTLTVDGEGINKYDFFDSDDVKKSIGGVIAKNVATLLPIFTPASGIYSTLLIAREFSKALPMLHGVATMLSDSNESPKWINNVAAFGSKMSGGTSQYAKEHTFSFENFGNLISDVALQWGQQKAISEAFNKIKGVDKIVKNAEESAKNLYKIKAKELGESEELLQACYNKFVPQAKKMATQAGALGRNASLAYMAVISNSDLYNEMRNMGLTNREAAAVSLGSTLGMFALNKYTGLGEIFYDDATDDAVKMARKAIKEEMKNAADMFKSIKNSSEPEPHKYLKFIKTASDKVGSVLSKFSDDLKYHTLNFVGKAAGEGLEEVSEELISDVAKEIYELAGVFGADTTLKDIGAWDNALERYTMSFLGGAIGGGIFYGREAIMDGKSYKRDSKNWELANLIRNGHANELRTEIEKRKKAGKLGSTTISASKYGENENGERVYLTTDKKEDSQNDAIANAMLDKINALEAVINNNRIGLSDDQLFENMVLTEKRYKRYQNIAPLTNYYQDFANITDKLIAAELDLKKASTTIEGTVNGTPKSDTKLTPEQEAARQQQLLPLQQRVEELRKQKDEFLAGDTSLEYTRKLNFLIDPKLHEQFLSIDQNQFFKEKYGDRKPEELSPEEQIKFIFDWKKKVESTLKEEVNQSWERYKEKEAQILPELEALGALTPEYKKFSKETENLFSGVLDVDKLYASYLTYDSRLEGESDEDYEFRNTRKKFTTTIPDAEGNLVQVESEENQNDFDLRRLRRTQQIDAYNTQKDQEWVDKVNEHLSKVNYAVDPFTFRYLRRALPQRQRDIVERKLALSQLAPNIRQIFKKLKPDLSNVDEINQLIYASTIEQSKSRAKSILSEIEKLDLEYSDGTSIDLNEYVVIEPDGELTLKTISENPNILDIQSPELVQYLIDLIPILGENTTFAEVIQNGFYMLENNANLEQYAKSISSVYESQLGTLINDVKNNPIYNLADSIKATVKNPIGELIKSLASKNGDEIPNVDELLDLIQDDFENIEDVQQLILDDTQMNNLKKVRDYMKLIGGFMYAAASNPDKNNPVGHNQVINTFAQTHKETLLKEWKPLPEIESDYYTLYDQAMSRYTSEIDYWIDMSNNNNVNKIRKFVATDRAFNTALLDSVKSREWKIKIDDIEFDLLEGFTEGEFDPEVKLFNAEQTLHRNFQLALQKTGLSVSDFMKKSGLLEKLVPSLSNISKQSVAKLDETIKKENLTDFDLVQYFAQIFALNPSQFYSELKSKVSKNDKIAPITAQEYSTKLAKAIASKQYRDIMKYAYDKSGSKLPFLSNSIILPGVAGAGKTAVVLSSVNDPNEEVIVAGPTKTQADNLQKSLNRKTSHTFSQLLELILGKEQLIAVKNEFDSITSKQIKDGYNGKYFTGSLINGVSVVTLKRDAITFTSTLKPKKLFLDEATHLNPIELQILDAFADSIDAVVYLAGDPNQRGYFSPKSGVENLQEDQVFASRAPKLSISLRDNNLQKYLNQENVRGILDQVNESLLNLSTEDLKQFWTRTQNTISKLNFKVYNHDELNGDLITTDLNSELLAKLKGKTVGFIGENSSSYLQKLRDAGLEPTVLSMNEMQGEEFDFVVIDHEWKAPPADFRIKEFLTDLYTAMTRARTASIFIDNGLSDIIGKNVLSDNKSKAPSILAGVDELRAKKLAILDQFKLDLSEVKPEGEEVKKEEKKPEPSNPEENFIDPDKKNVDPELPEKIQEMVAQDEVIIKETSPDNFAKDGDHLVETFTDVTILGVEKSEPQKRVVDYNGKDVEVEVPIWTVTHPQQGPLRNLQAFYKNGEELVKYDDKNTAQRMLFDLKSVIIYQYDYDKLPSRIRQRFISKQDWEQGELEIEIREPNVSDTTHLNAKYKEAGFKYNGKRYIANIVYKVKLKNGEIAKFDISGLPSVDSFYKNLNTIKDHLRERISKASEEEKTKLQEKLNNMDATFAHYEQLVGTWISQYEEGTFTPINLDQSTINFNKTTWFQDLVKSESETSKLAKLQLGGRLNPITGERSRDSLELRHPELVFSPIYTYASDPEWFENHDNSLKGKAVILVSSDTTLRSDELMSVYMDQKYNPDQNTARVRMLVLDNYGMTFSQFIDKDFIKAFQHGDEERKPFRQNYTGIRMFTALWNWRAGLIKFNEEVENWKVSQGYSDLQVEALTKADQLLYDASRPENSSQSDQLRADATTLLSNNNLSDADLTKLQEFNTTGLENVPTFRLGYSKNGNGFYVKGNVDVSSSSLYNGDKANLLAITPSKAKQFQTLVDRILGAIEYSDTLGNETLGIKLLEENGESWDKSKLIDLSDAKHKRTLSGLLSDEYGAITLNSNGIKIKYEKGDQWSVIPAVVSNIVRTITWYQHNNEDSQEMFHARIKLGDGEDRWLLQTQINDLFSNGTLNLGSDSSLFDMLNLAFHGTIQDIHKKLTPGESLLQLEDAYFKQGFFISPDISRTSARHGDPDIFKITGTNGEVLFYKIETSTELFTVDTDVRTSGLGLRINQIYKNTQEEEKKQEQVNPQEDPEERFKQEHPDLSAIIELGNTVGHDFSFDMDSAQEAVAWRNKDIKENIQTAITRKNPEVLNFPYKIDLMGDVVKTTSLKEYISSNIGSDSFDVEFNEDLIIKSGGVIYTMDSDFNINKVGGEIKPEVSKYDQKLSDGKTVKKAMLEILTNKQTREELINTYNCMESDLDELYVILNSLFNSTRTEDEIKQELDKLDESNDTYSLGLLGFIDESENYSELNEILNNC